MKKKIFTLLAFALCVFVGMIVYSCKKELPIPDPGLQDILAIQDEFSIDAEGGTINVNFKTNCNWSLTVQDDWLSASRVSGTASNSAFDVTVRQNRGTESRSSKIVVKAGSKTAEVTITQSAPVVIPTELKVNQTYEFDAEGGSVKVEFTTNKEWSVAASEPWLLVDESSGTSEESFFTLTVGENPEVESREAYLVLTVEDTSATIVVTQAGNPKAETQLEVCTTLPFGYEGGPLTVDFVTNKDWTVSTDADWLAIDPVSGTPEKASFAVIADTNPDPVKRTAEVVVSAGEKSATISVVQEEAPADGDVLIVEGDNVVGSDDGAVFKNGVFWHTVYVTSSTDWMVSIGEEDYAKDFAWIAGGEADGRRLYCKASDTSFVINYRINNDLEPRTATFVITAGDKTAYFVLRQDAFPADELTVLDSEVRFGPEASTVTLDFRTSYAWTASANVPWITLSATEGEGNSFYDKNGVNFDISVSDNDRGTQRTGIVTVTSHGRTVNVTVTQLGADIVEFECDVFKNYCLTNFDRNHDGELNTDEAQAITEIWVYAMDVRSLKGIECMPNLVEIQASKTKLQSLDLTGVPSLVSFDASEGSEIAGVVDCSKCPRLTGINIPNSKVTGLIFKNNRVLKGFAAQNCCLTGVLDLTEAGDDPQGYILWNNPDLKEVIVKDEKFIERVYCDEGVKITVRH